MKPKHKPRPKPPNPSLKQIQAAIIIQKYYRRHIAIQEYTMLLRDLVSKQEEEIFAKDKQRVEHALLSKQDPEEDDVSVEQLHNNAISIHNAVTIIHNICITYKLVKHISALNKIFLLCHHTHIHSSFQEVS